MTQISSPPLDTGDKEERAVQRVLRRWSSEPWFGLSSVPLRVSPEDGEVSLLPTAAQRAQLEASPVQRMELPMYDVWKLYQNLVGAEYEDYLCSIYKDVEVGPWMVVEGASGHLVRKIQYVAPTEVRWGPSASRMVEMQEVQHLPGGAFVRWSAVQALDALMGDRFHVHMRVRCFFGEAEAAGAARSPPSVPAVEQQVALVFRRTALGFGSVIQKEARSRCQASLEGWKVWATEGSARATEQPHKNGRRSPQPPLLRDTSEVDDDAAGARCGRRVR